MHILIVDDNPINRQYFSMALKKANFNITLAEDGFEAIEYAKTTRYDLILMDIRMPELDGYETTKHIHQLPNHKSTPVLATSAEGLIEEKKSLFNDFLPKPISPKLLVSNIQKHIDLNKTFDENSALAFSYNDKKIMHKLVTMFVNDLPKKMQLLASSIETDNIKSSTDIIHQIRGSCKICGAKDLDNKLRQLSNKLKVENNPEITEPYTLVKNAAREYLTFNFENM